jgi:hypothetical protein
MRVLVSGSSGLVGRAVCEELDRTGHAVLHLVRPQSLDQRPANGAVKWDPAGGAFDGAAAESADAVVHLAGASVAEWWTPAHKALLRTSRVEATRHLVGELAKLARPPKVFVAASAIGSYGSRGDEQLTEQSAPGNDFLAELGQAWEAESQRAAQALAARVVLLRIGVVLARHGGALGKMLTAFKLGAGGVIGSGRQWMSWIALPDLVDVLVRALADDSYSGPINAVAPGAVTNREFTKTLGKVLGRPTIFPMPAFAARLAFGEMADALLLASQRVVPARLQQMSHTFAHPTLESALRAVLQA